MTYPAPTTGIGIAARITLDSSAVALTLGPNSNTHQIALAVEDVAGTPLNPTETLTYVSDKPKVATVSPTGLITGVSRGRAIVTVRYPWAGNTIASINGNPVVANPAELPVFVGY